MTKKQKRDAIAVHKAELQKRKEIEAARPRVQTVGDYVQSLGTEEQPSVVAPILPFWPEDEVQLPPAMPVLVLSLCAS